MKTKERILKIALKLFIERGFLDVSIKDLIKEAGITKSSFYYYFNSKDQLICEALEKLFFSRFDDVIRISDECNLPSKDKLLRIFQIYSETESYLKNNLRVERCNHKSIICLIVEGIKDYKFMTNCIVHAAPRPHARPGEPGERRRQRGRRRHGGRSQRTGRGTWRQDRRCHPRYRRQDRVECRRRPPGACQPQQGGKAHGADAGEIGRRDEVRRGPARQGLTAKE